MTGTGQSSQPDKPSGAGNTFASHVDANAEVSVPDAGTSEMAIRQMLFDKVHSDTSLTLELREKKLAEIKEYLDSRPAALSSSRSGSRSAQPEKFHGFTADHGQVAKNWLYGVELYFMAEPTHNPVAKACL